MSSSYLIYILAIILGLSLGSFFGVIIDRLYVRKGIIGGHSKCYSCGKRIAWYDLIPVLSFLFLQGKCRHCKASIGGFLPLVEIGTATIFALAVYAAVRPSVTTQPLIQPILFICIILLLTLILFFDLRRFLIPDIILIPLAVLSLVYVYFFSPLQFLHHIGAGFLYAGIFAILYLAGRGKSVGFGDVKLALVIGWLCGYLNGLTVILFAVWSAGAIGLIMLIARRANLRSPLPFGAFLALFVILHLIFPHEIRIFNPYF